MTTANKKVAIVTGGGSGIGYAITEKFISAGIHTVIVGRDEEKLKSAKDKLGELCYPIACDISDLKLIPGLVEGIVKQIRPDRYTGEQCGYQYEKRIR